MNQSKACCKDLLSGFSQPRPSPFDKQINLSYYDGSLIGALQCSACTTAYTYRIIDWDSKFDKRIFVLSRLPEGTFAQVIDALSSGGQTPRWPYWAPNREPDDAKAFASDGVLENLFSTSGPALVLLLSDRCIETVFASHVPESELSQEIQASIDRETGVPNPSRDWFQLFGRPR